MTSETLFDTIPEKGECMEDMIRCYWDDFSACWIAESTDGSCISSCAGTPELAADQVRDIMAANEAMVSHQWNQEFDDMPPREFDRSPWG